MDGELEQNQGSVEAFDKNRVKILMLQKDISQVHIVNKYKFDKGDVSKVVHGKRRTKAIQEAIARELDMGLDEVFGMGPA